MENNKMYLTETEAKAKGLGTVQEQIDRYNAALPKTTYVLRGLDANGKTAFYTGKAGEGWVSPNRDASFGYVSLEVARGKAKLFNGRVSLTGLWFVAIPWEGMGTFPQQADHA
jgi:hypothetical protein